MPKSYFLLLAAGLLAQAPAQAQTAPAEAKPLLGFEPARAPAQYQLEAKFDAQLKADNQAKVPHRWAARHFCLAAGQKRGENAGRKHLLRATFRRITG